MEQLNNMEVMLWDYLDGNLLPSDKEKVEQLLRDDPEWKKALQEIIEMDALIHATNLEEPSMRFSKNVMDEIAKHTIAPAAKSYVNRKVIYGIAAFFLVIISSLLILLFMQVNLKSAGTNNYLNELPQINFNWKNWINSTYMQIFLMADVVIGLMLLDRYLASKRNRERMANHV